MKKSLLKNSVMLLAMLMFTQVVSAQQRVCYTMQHMADMQAKDPKLKQRYEEAEKTLQQWIQRHPAGAQRTSAVPDTIPVVVHVVYKTTAQNISDAQINSQIQVLNDDFARMNADTVNTPVAFRSLAGGIPYRFILARRDPNGNPTTGIVRVSTTTTTFSTNDDVKFTANGGSDAWNTSQYLNIWVCNLGNTLLGYGEFPSGVATPTRGFVCNFDCFGTIGTAAAPFNGGRTTTHEIGHCFDLYHIWGDDNGACSGTDYVSDTPNQASETYGNPSFPQTDACSAASPGIMFMNYMDYTDDAAMNMFTNGQITRITASIQNFYAGLINSPGIVPVNLPVDDASLTVVVSPSGTTCSGTVIPTVRLKNAGAGTLTAADINYSFDGGAVQTYSWTGSLASLATVDVNLPAQTLASGAHSFLCYSSAPNGNADPNTGNDSLNITFSIGGASLPYAQTFEGAFPPSGHEVVNDDAGVTWARTTAGKHAGSASMYMDNANYAGGNGMADDFVLPGLDMSVAGNYRVTFWRAYKLWTNPTSAPNYSDTLQVLISTDCGVTFNKSYEKYGTALTTATPVFQASDFIPTANQWVKDSVDIDLTLGGSSNVKIKFRNVSDYENNLYIDDINISQVTTGIAEMEAASGFALYPNPSTGLVYIQGQSLTSGKAEVIVRNILGSVVMTIPVEGGEKQLIDLSNLSNGSYTVEIRSDKNAFNQRVTISK